MPKFTGTLMFDVEIEEQDSESKVENLKDAIVKAIDAVTGVNNSSCVDTDINEDEDDE